VNDERLGVVTVGLLAFLAHEAFAAGSRMARQALRLALALAAALVAAVGF
jgi:hypothetical protein